MVEVGDFIRTKSQIAKIIGYDDDNNFLLDIQQIITKTEAKNLKHSKNIIDLIEVGDIIQYKVINISTTLETKGYIEGITDIEDEEMINRIKKDENYIVETILTHEQYKQNAYEVEK